jgi:hypothetical protein
LDFFWKKWPGSYGFSQEAEHEFWLIIFNAGNEANDVIKEVASMGVRILEQEEDRGLYYKVRVSQPVKLLKQLQEQPSLCRIEKVYPVANMDEVADQVVVGNYNALGQVVAPPPGVNPYLDWLEEVGVDGTGITIGIVEYEGRIDEDHVAFTGRISAVGATNGKGYHATMVGGQAAGDYRTDVDDNGFIYGIGVAIGKES